MVHAVQAAPSRRHSNVEPLLEEVNANVALVAVVDAGRPELIVVCGGTVSIVKVRLLV